MENTDLIDRIAPIFREVFDDDGLVVTTEMTADDIDEWDSLSHIRLIVSHEIARLIGVQVVGSYNPSNIGCTADEFFDAVHGKTICLTKLERASVSYRSSKE